VRSFPGLGIRHYQRGFHATSTVALFCAVGALARRFRLSNQQTRMAMSLAASTAAGIHANFGTMTKPFHSGWAAQSAVVAVDLVRAGFTASPSALEDKGGYLAAYGTDESDADTVLPLLGKPWAIVSYHIISRPICAIWHAEGRLKTNDAAELKGQNSREICPTDATLGSGFNSTLDQEAAWPLNVRETPSALQSN
jgi:2-methylcitrate dehydratase PrpD